jgi:UDP-N-acetylmuramyl pentapeptide phosphotransferase/UDP-N-acetylglucosamine-1-phosphate transferase
MRGRLTPASPTRTYTAVTPHTIGKMTVSDLLPVLCAVVVAAIVSAIIIVSIRPILLRHAMAQPNARSSHRVPTPQGAGIAVMVATLVVAGMTILQIGAARAEFPALAFSAIAFIAVVGAVDDFKTIEVIPRLILQALAVGAVLVATSHGLRILPAVPVWIEQGLLFLAGLWFVNLVNFMDGIDWITVAEVVPITAALVVLGTLGNLPPAATIAAAALGGATIGFAPFNRPVAKIFLGDVGSLPIGLLLGWCLLELACRGQLAAALLLPLYYLADATGTLLRRLVKREPVWIAHRSHFYQRATDNGFSVLRIVSEIFVLNICLGALSIGSAITASTTIRMTLFLAGCVAVALLMFRFSRRR